ncbi:Olfactory receptor 10AG1 [Lemmus lemmus]
MYFFLTNFSFLEICYVSVTLPRILYNIWTQDKNISLLACATQMYFFLMLAATDSILLAVMSYDRYVAICNPLHYPVVMNQTKCTQLAVGSWLNSNLIDHFFCDIPPVLKLACGDTSLNELYVYVVAILLAAIPFILILTSYSKIIATILRLPTAQGRAKAFSTSSITYLMPKSTHSALSDKLLSLFYTIVTPMFNPLIYSLRNKDVIAALRRLLHRA